LLFEMAAGLQKGSMENGIEQRNAKQQGAKFSKFQKHGQFSQCHPNHPRTAPVQGDTH
jgi:hypothetical protein